MIDRRVFWAHRRRPYRPAGRSPAVRRSAGTNDHLFRSRGRVVRQQTRRPLILN